MLNKEWNHSPHIVLLGAGASRATCPEGDANGKILPLMDDLVDILNLSEMFKRENISLEGIGFEELYDSFITDGRLELAKNIEKKIYDYFSGIRLPDKPTSYDYLILSLREKDLIATFNWDPLLLQAYRRNLKVKKLPQLSFLHGNVGLGVCYADRTVGYIDTLCGRCNEPFMPVKLMYPVRQKDYDSDLLIKDQWSRIRDTLKVAYYFTVFGYRKPVSDVVAKDLMLEIWKANQTLNLAQIEIIDIRPQNELENVWKEFFVRNHYGIFDSFFDSRLYRYPRRSCESLSVATLMLSPMKENKFPNFNTLEELHEWIAPLVEEEITQEELQYA